MNAQRVIVAVLGLVLSHGALAQIPTADAEPMADVVPEPVEPPLDEASIPGEAARLDDTLGDIRARSHPPRTFRGIAERLPVEESSITTSAGVTRLRVGAPGAAAEVRDARASWARVTERLGRERLVVEEYTGRLERDRRILEDLHA